MTYEYIRLNYLKQQHKQIHSIEIILREAIRSERQSIKTWSLYNHSKAYQHSRTTTHNIPEHAHSHVPPLCPNADKNADPIKKTSGRSSK